MDLTTNARNRHALAILCRSITESATKLSWICRAETESRVRRFVADGLHADIEFRAMIESNIAARGGKPTAQEARFLRAIAGSVRESGMTEDEIQSQRALPNMYQMLQQLGYPRSYYVGIQSIPSQAVHGNWSDLIAGYLCPDTDPIRPRTSHSVPNAGQYVGAALVVLAALAEYARVVVDSKIAPELQSGLQSIEEWVHETYRDVCAYELEPEADATEQTDETLDGGLEG